MVEVTEQLRPLAMQVMQGLAAEQALRQHGVQMSQQKLRDLGEERSGRAGGRAGEMMMKRAWDLRHWLAGRRHPAMRLVSVANAP